MKYEIWKPVIGYEGFYEVSNLGRLRSVDKYIKGKGNSIRLKKGKILKSQITKIGYLLVVLTKDKKIKGQYVHRLVAEAFIPNPTNLPCVNHKNECKTDNRIENLEWCTYGYNINYGTRNEKVSKALTKPKKPIKSKLKPVYKYSLDGKLIATYLSISEAARQTGISKGNISQCCNGRLKTAGGFIWRFK